MNSFLCSLAFAATLVIVSGRPQVYSPQGPYTDKFIPIVKYDSNPPVEGSYSYGFETGNGIQQQEAGQLKPSSNTPEGVAQTAQGVSVYTSPEGVPIQLEYYADETGFHPSGAHLPTPPPIPDVILKAIATLPKLPEEAYKPAPPGSPQYYNPSPAPYSPTPAPYSPTPAPYSPFQRVGRF